MSDKRISVDPRETEKFTAMMEQWWDPTGDFKPLHRLNPVRLRFIRDKVVAHFGLDPQSLRPFEGLKFADVGCGGGLICEPMARLGAQVLGADATEKAVEVARLHAAQSGLDIDYRLATAEELAHEGERADVVLALEVIEHVASIEHFLDGVTTLVKPGGLLVITTLNRTAKALALAVIGAEYVLRWLPRGTHDWRKFVKPGEIRTPLAEAGFDVQPPVGVSYNVFKNSWELSNDVDVGYMICALKPGAN